MQLPDTSYVIHWVEGGTHTHIHAPHKHFLFNYILRVKLPDSKQNDYITEHQARNIAEHGGGVIV